MISELPASTLALARAVLLALAAGCSGPGPAEPQAPAAPASSPTGSRDLVPDPRAPAPPGSTGACGLELVAVEADERFRGYPDSPARRAAEAAQGPEARRMDIAESHAASYRSCTYRVRALGQEWRWTQTWDTTFEDLPVDHCTSAWPEVAERIEESTKGCTEPGAGAYYGQVLEPRD